MQNVRELLAAWTAIRQRPLNRALHAVCVPLMAWALVALLWLVPVPQSLGRAGLWAAAAMLPAFVYYRRLSLPLGLAMAAAFVLCAIAAEAALRLLGQTAMLRLALVVLAAALLGQLGGHLAEGNSPRELLRPRALLAGPAWIVATLLRKLGVRL